MKINLAKNKRRVIVFLTKRGIVHRKTPERYETMNNSMINLTEAAAINWSKAAIALEKAKAFGEWVRLTDEEREQARFYPWLRSHVQEMDQMAKELNG